MRFDLLQGSSRFDLSHSKMSHLSGCVSTGTALSFCYHRNMRAGANASASACTLRSTEVRPRAVLSDRRSSAQLGAAEMFGNFLFFLYRLISHITSRKANGDTKPIDFPRCFTTHHFKLRIVYDVVHQGERLNPIEFSQSSSLKFEVGRTSDSE